MSIRSTVLVAWLLTAGLGAQEAVAERARAAIAAADAARSAEAAEADALAQERLRAEAAIALLAARAAAERRAIAELEARLAELEAEAQELAAKDAERFEWEAPLAAVHAGALERLAVLAPRLPPGVLPAAGDDEEGTAQALLDLHRRLRSGLDAAARWSLGIEEGRLGDEVRAVNLLRCGAVACWWSALEGTRAGTARMVEGELVLSDASDDEQRRAIAKAIAIAADRATPELVDLPFAPAEAP